MRAAHSIGIAASLLVLASAGVISLSPVDQMVAPALAALGLIVSASNLKRGANLLSARASMVIALTLIAWMSALTALTPSHAIHTLFWGAGAGSILMLVGATMALCHISQQCQMHLTLMTGTTPIGEFTTRCCEGDRPIGNFACEIPDAPGCLRDERGLFEAQADGKMMLITDAGTHGIVSAKGQVISFRPESDHDPIHRRTRLRLTEGDWGVLTLDSEQDIHLSFTLRPHTTRPDGTRGRDALLAATIAMFILCIPALDHHGTPVSHSHTFALDAPCDVIGNEKAANAPSAKKHQSGHAIAAITDNSKLATREPNDDTEAPRFTPEKAHAQADTSSARKSTPGLGTTLNDLLKHAHQSQSTITDVLKPINTPETSVLSGVLVGSDDHPMIAQLALGEKAVGMWDTDIVADSDSPSALSPRATSRSAQKTEKTRPRSLPQFATCDAAERDRVIDASMHDVSACYHSRLEMRPYLRGQLTLKLDHTPSYGDTLTLGPSTLQDPTMEACVLGAVRQRLESTLPTPQCSLTLPLFFTTTHPLGEEIH